MKKQGFQHEKARKVMTANYHDWELWERYFKSCVEHEYLTLVFLCTHVLFPILLNRNRANVQRINFGMPANYPYVSDYFHMLNLKQNTKNVGETDDTVQHYCLMTLIIRHKCLSSSIENQKQQNRGGWALAPPPPNERGIKKRRDEKYMKTITMTIH